MKRRSDGLLEVSSRCPEVQLLISVVFTPYAIANARK